jgi:hypothetical protein
VVEIDLELPGVRTVAVGICAADAVRLSRGEEPDVGAVTVGRRSLPWAAAPTWYGGWGWGQDDLPALRYHGVPVFSSRAQLDEFAGPRSITVRPAPVASDPDDLAVEAPVARFIPDDDPIHAPVEEEPVVEDAPVEDDAPGDDEERPEA